MFTEYRQYLENYTQDKILVFLHNNADPDAVGAALAFIELSNTIRSDIDILVFADGVNQSSRNALSHYQINFPESVPDGKYLIVTLDTANSIQLGKYRAHVDNHEGDRAIIDHHSTRELADEATMSLLDTVLVSQ